MRLGPLPSSSASRRRRPRCSAPACGSRPRHLAASGGMLVDGLAAYDAVRPGLATYGIVPDELVTGPGGTAPAGLEAASAGLVPVLSLHARPVRVAEVPAGWGISYGPSFTTRRPSRIATLPLGYGDGWPRSLSNRASALVRGRRVPLVGNVAMDAVMADVTDVPGEPISVADEFVLLGRQGSERITAAEIAAARGDQLLGGRHGPLCAPASGVPCGLRSPGDADARGPSPGGRREHRRPEHRRPEHRRRERQEVDSIVSEASRTDPDTLGEEQRDELVEEVAREIQLRGLTASAVHFLQASRPYRPLGANAMLFFDPVLHGLFGGELPSASALLADEDGIEQLIDRLEDFSEESGWDA